MASGKGKHHRRGFRIGKYIGMFGKIAGGLIIASPAVEVVVSDMQSGNFQSIGNDLLFAYTGLGGSTPINFQQAAKGIGSVVGGILVIKLFSWVAKRV